MEETHQPDQPKHQQCQPRCCVISSRAGWRVGILNWWWSSIAPWRWVRIISQMLFINGQFVLIIYFFFTLVLVFSTSTVKLIRDGCSPCMLWFDGSSKYSFLKLQAPNLVVRIVRVIQSFGCFEDLGLFWLVQAFYKFGENILMIWTYVKI